MNKKELKKQYKQTVLPMGIFQVKNLTSGKIFIDAGLNIQGKINGCKFQLALGSHMNKALQEDFNETGITNFSFGVIDYLKPKEDLKMDYADDLKMLFIILPPGAIGERIYFIPLEKDNGEKDKGMFCLSYFNKWRG